ncbi:hypothetical protein SAXI111661_14995 [Saccharomonospora xinjiangensis]|nr:hypothetical protein EYD13_17450 [Saccharomonospora xinjiangensis]
MRAAAGLPTARWLFAARRFVPSWRGRHPPAPSRRWLRTSLPTSFVELVGWRRGSPTRWRHVIARRAWLSGVLTLPSRRWCGRATPWTGAPLGRRRRRLVLRFRCSGRTATRSRSVPRGRPCRVHDRACPVVLRARLVAWRGSGPWYGFLGLVLARLGTRGFRRVFRVLLPAGAAGRRPACLGVAGLGVPCVGRASGGALLHHAQCSHEHGRRGGARHHREAVDKRRSDGQCLGQHVAALGQARRGQHDEWNGQRHCERWLHHRTEKALALDREDSPHCPKRVTHVEDHGQTVRDDLICKGAYQRQPERQQRGTPPGNAPAGIEHRAFVPLERGRVLVGALRVTPSVTNGGHEATPYPLRRQNR